MAPLPANNTGRYFVDYTANGRQHTVLFRYTQGAGPVPPSAGFLTQVQNFLDAVAPLMPTDFAIVGARYSAWLSNISLPWAAPTLSVAGAYTPDNSSAPGFLSFIGRGDTGRRVRIYMLGAGLVPHQETGVENYRVTTAENADVSSAVAILQSGNFTDIGNTTPAWYSYANLGYNAYWQKEMRN